MPNYGDSLHSYKGPMSVATGAFKNEWLELYKFQLGNVALLRLLAYTLAYMEGKPSNQPNPHLF
jgi:hypothetical protein